MPRSLIIVDDFLANPDALRSVALRLDYPAEQGMFPGRNSAQRVPLDGLDAQVSGIVGEPLRAIEPAQSHGKCRLALAGDTGRGRVHIDQSHWSGILYLTPPEQCRGGTEFFRHKATGTDRPALTDEEARAHGYASPRDMATSILAADSLRDDAWELAMRVPMRFNRLVLLRPWFWHSAGAAFGDGVDNGRLIYLMFFQQR